jgi:hypothetical protein
MKTICLTSWEVLANVNVEESASEITSDLGTRAANILFFLVNRGIIKS